MNAETPISEAKKEACKTYLEQTKLLVTLASAFLFAPAALVGILKDKTQVGLTNAQIIWFIVAEVFFILSVLAGYIVLGSVTGSQHSGEFNVFRPATRCFSLLQFGFYLAGLIVFIGLALAFVK
jgi:hypothetical protein